MHLHIFSTHDASDVQLPGFWVLNVSSKWTCLSIRLSTIADLQIVGINDYK